MDPSLGSWRLKEGDGGVCEGCEWLRCSERKMEVTVLRERKLGFGLVFFGEFYASTVGGMRKEWFCSKLATRVGMEHAGGLKVAGSLWEVGEGGSAKASAGWWRGAIAE